jgi:hypothetical protein
MPWTATNQTTAQQVADNFASEYASAVDAWTVALRSGGNAIAAKGRVTDIVTRWRQSVNDLEQQSDAVMSDQTAMDQLGQLATQVAQERATLAKLQSEAGSRNVQADSVNPKAKTSPYTNILGLRRTFRESTRLGILIASLVFGVLALVALGFLGYALSGPIVAAAVSVSGAATGAMRSTGSGTGPTFGQRGGSKN